MFSYTFKLVLYPSYVCVIFASLLWSFLLVGHTAAAIISYCSHNTLLLLRTKNHACDCCCCCCCCCCCMHVARFSYDSPISTSLKKKENSFLFRGEESLNIYVRKHLRVIICPEFFGEKGKKYIRMYSAAAAAARSMPFLEQGNVSMRSY